MIDFDNYNEIIIQYDCFSQLFNGGYYSIFMWSITLK